MEKLSCMFFAKVAMIDNLISKIDKIDTHISKLHYLDLLQECKKLLSIKDLSVCEKGHSEVAKVKALMYHLERQEENKAVIIDFIRLHLSRLKLTVIGRYYDTEHQYLRDITDSLLTCSLSAGYELPENKKTDDV